jgi:lysophospholipase L1-like esterase
MIVCLGDSTTAGTPLFKSPVEAPPDGVGEERSQFAYWLRQAHPGWQVLNCGVNGERTDQIAQRFERDVLAHHPRVVIIIAGVNDVYQGLPASRVTSELEALYNRALASGLRVVAGSIVPYNTAGDDQNARMHAVNAWIAQFAGTHAGVWFVDTRKAAADPDHPNRLAASPDGLHPDIAGYRAMAAALEPAIEAALGTYLFSTGQGEHRT